MGVWSLSHIGGKAFPALLWSIGPLLVLAVRRVCGGVGATLIVLQRQIAVGVRVTIYTHTHTHTRLSFQNEHI